MKKKIIISIICFVILLACWFGWYFLFHNKNSDYTINLWDSWNDTEGVYNTSWESDWNLHILTSIDDEVVGDSMWCWTFQLVWNDMVNEVVKQDVVFTPQPTIVENLNKQTFSKKYLSPNSYYAKFWLLTLDLKEEIEKWIKKKFNETSDILDQWADWSTVPQSDDYYDWKPAKKYLFYTILKKIFKFKNVFDQLDNWKFGDKYDDIKYFWIKWSSDTKLYKQVYVYYYNSKSDFAVALKTKEWEDVILARWIWWSSFISIYRNIIENAKKYAWNHNFTKNDYLKVPELNFKSLTEFYELEDKDFFAKDWAPYRIFKALQSIELKLDEKWWEIKSEALIIMGTNSAPIKPVDIEHRYFNFDQPYVIMLKESNKDLPYFAAQISDITLFQK